MNRKFGKTRKATELKKLNKAEKPEKMHIKTTRRTRKLKVSSGAFIAPSLLGVLLFFILPFIVIIWYSMVDNPISANFVFLDNFKSIIANSAFKRAVRN
ncbi:MAG: hypothetical protein K2J60_03855, partial [Acetatifactor sp.]|nr:hypothetical protein [Acetatifactor sp.]